MMLKKKRHLAQRYVSLCQLRSRECNSVWKSKREAMESAWSSPWALTRSHCGGKNTGDRWSLATNKNNWWDKEAGGHWICLHCCVNIKCTAHAHEAYSCISIATSTYAWCYGWKTPLTYSEHPICWHLHRGTSWGSPPVQYSVVPLPSVNDIAQQLSDSWEKRS